MHVSENKQKNLWELRDSMVGTALGQAGFDLRDPIWSPEPAMSDPWVQRQEKASALPDVAPKHLNKEINKW